MYDSEITYPKFDIEVPLSGRDGNVFSIMGNMKRELRRAGATKEQISEFLAEAMDGSYEDLIRTCAKWVNIS
jgi:hypothetical protein